MKQYLLLTLVLSTTLSFGQNIINIFNDTINTGHQINISSFNYYSSNSFNNDLTNKFIYGGNITSDIKDFNQSKLGRSNSFGAEVEQKIEYINFDVTPLKKWNQFGLIFTLEDLNYMSSNLSSDLYNFMFYGNKNYIGDTLNFSYSHIQFQRFQKIGFGFIHKKTKSSLQLSFVNGNRSIDYRLGNTWLYTSPLSDSIKFNLNAEGHSTDSVKTNFTGNGYGFSLDFNHNFIYQDKNNNRQVINLKLSNMGVIFWNKQTSYTYVDSANVWSGIDVLDLINKDTSKATLASTTLSDTLGVFNTNRTKAELLPFELSIEKLADRYSNKKLQLIFGFKSIISSDYKPYIFVGAYYSPNQKIGISSRMAYGGFGGLKFGLNANYWIKNKFEFAIGTYDIIGLASPKYGFGKSIHFATSIKF